MYVYFFNTFEFPLWCYKPAITSVQDPAQLERNNQNRIKTLLKKTEMKTIFLKSII